jgi:hypothetical protein
VRMLVCVAIVVVAPAIAHAFPEIALRSDTPWCGSCHVSPGGGGLLTEQGRDEAASSLSRGGDGRVFHGAIDVPEWLLLGGDFRVAGLVKDDARATERLELAAFPMQADLRFGARFGSVALVANAGLRGSTRGYDDSPRSYVVSTEHYALWSGSELYVRGGRFFPVQGLRLPDHTLYVRRYSGTNLYEEPYALAAGYTTTTWELHGSAFVHDPVLAVGRREAGGTLHTELHVEGATVAASARVGVGDDGLRAIGGLSTRLRFHSATVALAEVVAIRDQVAGAAGVTQAAAFAGVDHQLVQGVQLLGWYEHFEAALGYAPSYAHAAGLALKLYPRAHWEIIGHTRWQWIGGGERGALGMLQVHYYL